MENVENKRIRDFYLGNDKAWEEQSDVQTNPMVRWVDRWFANLPEVERGEVVPDFEMKFFVNVKEGRREAEIVINVLKQMASVGVEDAETVIRLLETIVSGSSKQPKTIVRLLERMPIVKVKEAEAVIDLLKNMPSARIDNADAIRIEICGEKTGFKFSAGNSFRSWSYTCLKRDIFNRLKRRGRIVEVDESENNYFDLVVAPQELETGLGSEDEVMQILSTTLVGDELIYMTLWFERLNVTKGYKPPSPSTDQVVAAIYTLTGRTIGAASVSLIKQRFLIGSHLALIEKCENLNSLASLFLRMTEIANVDDLAFELMMDNIWNTFRTDEEAVAVSRKISRSLWEHRTNLTHRRGVQQDILIEAYAHFRHLIPTRKVCAKIEFYANHRFGNRIREIFMTRG
ncbi:MAG: hypothetical protein IPL32_03440 [Chloracidobacterium sp.]|nr:hypothetical protein [Chloracidobacterium sp.]